MTKIPGTPDQLHNRRVWVDALRSGKYKQGKQLLKDGDGGMCCLGVACDLFALDEGMGEWKKASPTTWTHSVHFDLEGDKFSTYPPKAVWESWLGLPDKMGSYGDDAENLAAKNDAGLSFAEIANLIEAYYEVEPANV
jgi:hypothetical protein